MKRATVILVLTSLIAATAAGGEQGMLLEINLDDAALAAVREWHYEPATLHGKPVRVYMTVTVSFRLD